MSQKPKRSRKQNPRSKKYSKIFTSSLLPTYLDAWCWSSPGVHKDYASQRKLRTCTRWSGQSLKLRRFLKVQITAIWLLKLTSTYPFPIPNPYPYPYLYYHLLRRLDSFRRLASLSGCTEHPSLARATPLPSLHPYRASIHPSLHPIPKFKT